MRTFIVIVAMHLVCSRAAYLIVEWVVKFVAEASQTLCLLTSVSKKFLA